MRRRKVGLRVVIVAATVAACFGHALHLASTEQKQVTMPSSVVFPTTTIGTQSIRNITISPATGEQSDVVTAISTTSCQSGFTVNPGSLPRTVSSVCVAGSGTNADACDSFMTTSHTFSATFAPTVAGTVSCTLVVTLNGTQQQTILLSGTGQLPPIDIAIETGTPPTECIGCTHNFGDVNLTRDATPLTLGIRNQGSGTAMVTSLSLPSPFRFVVGNGNAVNIGPNQVVNVAITCTPDALMLQMGALTVNSNDPAGPKSIGLLCTGVQSNLQTSQTALTITTRVGEPVTFPAPSLQLTNTGTGRLTFTSVTVTGDDLSLVGGPSSGEQVDSMQNGTPMTLKFAPAKESSGVLGNVRVVFDSGMKDIPINGAALKTTMSLSTNGELGSVCSGVVTRRPYVMRADSAGGFALRGLVVPSPFSIIPISPSQPPTDANPINLLGTNGNNFMFDLAVDLTAPSPPAQLSGQMTFDTDIPVMPPEPLALSAKVLERGVGVSSTMVDFGSVDVGDLSNAQTRMLTITNCVVPSLEVRAEILGDTASFNLPAPPGAIDMAESGDLALQFLPSTPGPKFATLRLTHDGGAVDVALVGNGNALPPPEVDPRDTYYNCSAGSGTAWGAGVLIVLVGLRLRRRRRR